MSFVTLPIPQDVTIGLMFLRHETCRMVNGEATDCRLVVDKAHHWQGEQEQHDFNAD